MMPGGQKRKDDYPKRLVALVEAPGHVCYRYRIQPFEAAFASEGILVEAWPIARGPIRRFRQFWQLRHAHGVLLQRKLFAPWEISWLRKHSRILIYDIDDAVFQRDSFHPKGPDSGYRRLRFRLTVEAADLVLAGNAYLARCALKATQSVPSPEGDPAFRQEAEPCGKVAVIPTCVDPTLYPLRNTRGNQGPIRLVWIGSGATVPSLEQAAAHLQAASRKVPGIILRVVCDRLPGISGVPMELWRWSPESEVDALTSADIGIAWMPDDSWSLGKCGLKVLQYMAAGLPVVANPVGVHKEIVLSECTGILVSTTEDWAEAVFRLAFSPELRQRLGLAGRTRLEQHYSLQVWAPRLVQLIVGLLQRGKAGFPDKPARVSPILCSSKVSSLALSTVDPNGPLSCDQFTLHCVTTYRDASDCSRKKPDFNRALAAQ